MAGNLKTGTLVVCSLSVTCAALVYRNAIVCDPTLLPSEMLLRASERAENLLNVFIACVVTFCSKVTVLVVTFSAEPFSAVKADRAAATQVSTTVSACRTTILLTSWNKPPPLLETSPTAFVHLRRRNKLRQYVTLH